MGTFRITTSYRADGNSFSLNQEIDYDNVAKAEPTLEAAWTGTLTVRTDNDTGSVTAQLGHTITTGSKVDLFWLNTDGTYGQRNNVTVGTVAGQVVPIDLGAGDNLPLAATAVRIMNRHTEAMVVTGNNVVGILVNMPTPGVVTFADAANASLLVIDLTDQVTYGWFNGNGVTNPLAGAAVAKVFLSQYGVATQVPTITLLHN